MALIYLGLDEWKYRKSSLEEEVEAKHVGDVLTGAALSRVMAKPVLYCSCSGHYTSQTPHRFSCSLIMDGVRIEKNQFECLFIVQINPQSVR